MATKIYPSVWFDNKAKEAAEYYSGIFPRSKILSDSMHAVLFEASGQKFLFINGDSSFTPNPSISFYLVIEEKHQIDEIWKKLIDGGMVLMPLDQYEWSARYGWLQDKYGVNWQISLERIENTGKKFSPMLMFTGDNNGRAGEAITFYTSVFKNSSVRGISRYRAQDNDIEGNIVHAQFSVTGTVIMAMDSSLPHRFSFNEAVSLVVECDSQEEIDYYWDKLSDKPEAERCGWLKDKFGISWQVIPSQLNRMASDPEKAPAVFEALLKMKKLDIGVLEKAYNG